MNLRLSQIQTQKTVLSPQIRQYLKLLQIPVAQLEQTIQEELADNPLLEESQGAKTSEETGPEEAGETQEKEDDEELHMGESFDTFSKIDENFRFDYEDQGPTLRDPHETQKFLDFQEARLTKPEALSDFLLWQIGFIDLNVTQKKIAEEIIGNINEEGYLAAEVSEIAASLNVKEEQVKEVLKWIQGLDPPGIGAQTLQEALLLQLKTKGAQARVATQIVRDHLPLLEKRDWQQIARILAIDLQTVREAAEIITHLEPKPGRTFYIENPTAITPDASITLDDEDPDKLHIEIHDEHLPRLRINAYYRNLLRQQDTDKATKAFVREKLQSAFNFMKALSLRKSTLREITEEIVRIQHAFFKKGFSRLVPLRLKDISEKLQNHESTVSRALQGKYITTPQGTIPYKSFFSTRLETAGGEAESQKSIMQKIRIMIEAEDPSQPLSDQEIVKRLKAGGIRIARRTVAKYRDLLKILPSHLRRKR